VSAGRSSWKTVDLPRLLGVDQARRTIRALVQRTGYDGACFSRHNVYVLATNLTGDPLAYLDDFPARARGRDPFWPVSCEQPR